MKGQLSRESNWKGGEEGKTWNFHVPGNMGKWGGQEELLSILRQHQRVQMATKNIRSPPRRKTVREKASGSVKSAERDSS